MYCDCVHSYVEPFFDDDTSHESEEEDDADDEQADENQPVADDVLPVVTPIKPPRPPPLPDDDDDLLPPLVLVPKPKPHLNPNPPVVSPDKTQHPKPQSASPPLKKPKYTPDQYDSPDYDMPTDYPTYDKPLAGPLLDYTKDPANQAPVILDDVPIINSDMAGPIDVIKAYFRSGRIPVPFVNSPKAQGFIDAGIPMYYGPVDADDDNYNRFVEDLQKWYDSLSKPEKDSYLQLCLIVGPSGSGQNEYYDIQFQHRPSTDTKKNRYPYTYYVTNLQSGEKNIFQSTEWVPIRAFASPDEINKYWVQDSPRYWITRYDVPRSRGGKRIMRLEGDALGTRMAQKPQSSMSDVSSPPIAILDPSLNPPVVGPINPLFLTNGRGNTQTLNGIGYENYQPNGVFEPFFNAGFISLAFWKQAGSPTYPAGNVPNSNGFAGLISAVNMRMGTTGGAMSLLTSLNGSGPTTPEIAYDANSYRPIVYLFKFPCEMVNRYSNATSTAIVWVKMQYVAGLSYVDVTSRIRNVDGTFYYPQMFIEPVISINSIGNKYVNLASMISIRAEGASTGARVFANSQSPVFYICCRVNLPNNSTMLDSTLGSQPFIEVGLSTGSFQVRELCTMLKDNTVHGRFMTNGPIVGNTHEPFPLNFATGNQNYLNSALTMKHQITTISVANEMGLYKNGITLCGETTFKSSNNQRSFNRSIHWPMSYLGSVPNSTDSWQLRTTTGSLNIVGSIQSDVEYLDLGRSWLPMDYQF